MNSAHIKIIAWEHSRRVLKLILPISALFAFIDIANQGLEYLITQGTLDTAVSGGDARLVSPIVDYNLVPIVYFAAFVNILLLLVGNTNNTNLQFGVGQYYLRLPVNTWVLAGTRIVVNCLILAAVSWLLLLIHFKTIIIPERSISFSLVCMTIILCYLPMQLAAWTFGNKTAIGALAVLYAIIVYDLINFEIWLTVQYIDRISAAELRAAIIQNGVTVLAAIFVTILLCGYSLRFTRYNEQIPVYARVVSTVDKVVYFFRNRTNAELPRFVNAEAAQLWLEKRYAMNLFRNLFLGIMIVLFNALIIGAVLFNIRPSGLSIYELILFPLLFSAGFAGLINGIVNFRRQTSPLNAFTYTKPITTKTLSTIRLYSVFQSMLIPLLVVQSIVIVYVANVVINDYSYQVNVFGYMNSIPTLLTIYLGFLGLVVLTWCLCWSVTTLPWAVYFSYIIGLLVIIKVGYPIPDSIFYFGFALGFAPPLLLWVVAIKKFQVPLHLILTIPLAFGSLYAFFVGIDALPSEMDSEQLVTILCITVAAFMPFATVPVAIDFTRHR